MGMAGTQIVGRTIGDMIQGQSALKQLEFQKQRADGDQAQRDLINENNKYAPKISYDSGTAMIRTA